MLVLKTRPQNEAFYSQLRMVSHVTKEAKQLPLYILDRVFHEVLVIILRK